MELEINIKLSPARMLHLEAITTKQIEYLKAKLTNGSATDNNIETLKALEVVDYELTKLFANLSIEEYEAIGKSIDEDIVKNKN